MTFTYDYDGDEQEYTVGDKKIAEELVKIIFEKATDKRATTMAEDTKNIIMYILRDCSDKVFEELAEDFKDELQEAFEGDAYEMFARGNEYAEIEQDYWRRAL